MSLKSAEKTGTNEVTVKLSIDAQTFADATVKAYNKVKKNIAVPGFRKGKAPKAFIEKYYGEGVFYDDALEIAFPDVYEAAIEEAGLDIKPQSIPSLLKGLVEAGQLEKVDVKIKGKGTQKGSKLAD